MKRRIFTLMGLASILGAQNKPGRKKFYITGLSHTKDANDCTIPPIVCYGKDRVDALLNCCETGGLTVWSEEEWLRYRAALDLREMFDRACIDKDERTEVTITGGKSK